MHVRLHPPTPLKGGMNATDMHETPIPPLRGVGGCKLSLIMATNSFNER